MDNVKMGKFICKLRKEKKMTQKELAEQIHVTDKAISKWETGKGFPDIKLLETLADILDVSVWELMSGERSVEAQTVTSQLTNRDKINHASIVFPRPKRYSENTIEVFCVFICKNEGGKLSQAK